jgi:RND family efflux transporter MFP subunit
MAALLTTSIWMAGCDPRPPAPSPAITATQVQASTMPPAVTISPARADIPATELFVTTGPLVAEQQSDVAAQRDGRVVKIAAEIGDHVRRGQLLALLDDRALVSALDSRSARVASLRAQIAEWDSEQKMDQADLRRADQMRQEKIISEENWEHVRYKLDEVGAEIARYRAEELAAEAEMRSAQLQLEQSRVVAPFDGVVGRRSLRLDQEVKTGDVLFWVTAAAPLRILFTVPESAMRSFTVGAPLDLTTPTYPELHQTARVMRVSPVVDPSSDSVEVVGSLTHPSYLLKPGMSMQIRPSPSNQAVQ